MVNETDTTSTSSTNTSTGATLTSTATTSSSTASSSITTGGPSPTETDSESNTSSLGLTSSQKGGIAGGIVGAVTVTSLVFLLLWWLRRKRRRRQQGKGGDGSGNEGEVGANNRGAIEAVANETTETSTVEGQEREEEYKGVAMLASREKQELDGAGRALHELDPETAITPTTPTGNEKGALETKTRRLAELPGSLAAIAEMPTSEGRLG
ncbi:hypothetical protein BJX64DRAFT_285434 [Aspergillus heterothallicus]